MTHELRPRRRPRTRPRTVVAWHNLPLSTLGIIALFLWFAFGLIAQSSRWHSTPAYGNLLIIFDAGTWGWIHFGIAVALIAQLALRRWRWLWLGLAAHTMAFVLLVMWEAAFIIRWITDPKTTVVNVGSWAFFIAITLRSAMVAIDAEPDPPPADPAVDEHPAE